MGCIEWGMPAPPSASNTFRRNKALELNISSPALLRILLSYLFKDPKESNQQDSSNCLLIYPPACGFFVEGRLLLLLTISCFALLSQLPALLCPSLLDSSLSKFPFTFKTNVSFWALITCPTHLAFIFCNSALCYLSLLLGFHCFCRADLYSLCRQSPKPGFLRRYFFCHLHPFHDCFSTIQMPYHSLPPSLAVYKQILICEKKQVPPHLLFMINFCFFIGHLHVTESRARWQKT